MNAAQRASESRRDLHRRLSILEKKVTVLDIAIRHLEGGAIREDDEQT